MKSEKKNPNVDIKSLEYECQYLLNALATLDIQRDMNAKREIIKTLGFYPFKQVFGDLLDLLANDSYSVCFPDIVESLETIITEQPDISEHFVDDKSIRIVEGVFNMLKGDRIRKILLTLVFKKNSVQKLSRK